MVRNNKFRGTQILETTLEYFFDKSTPLDMYNGLSQVYLSNQMEETTCIQRVNRVVKNLKFDPHTG